MYPPITIISVLLMIILLLLQLSTFQVYILSICYFICLSVSRDTLQLFSCGADKSLMFHSLDKSNTEITFKRTHHVAEKASMYDMIVDPTTKFIATASQDKLLR